MTAPSRPNTPSARRGRSDEGLSIIFFAISLPAIISLLVLVVGGAFLMLNKSRLTDIAEMAAFSALKSYQASPWPNYPQRANDALDAANGVLGLNPLFSERETLADIALQSPTETGLLELGRVYRAAPQGAPPPAVCGGNYPCFAPYDPANPAEINGARITLHAAGRDALKVPFLERFASVNAKLVVTTSGSATIVVLDTSLSMTSDTHLGASTGTLPARGVYPASVLGSCATSGNAIQRSFCALQDDRTMSTPTVAGEHFKDDYRLVSGVLVDTFVQPSGQRYIGPEPLSSAFTLANVALRKTAQLSFPGDSWRVVVVRGLSPELVPLRGEPGLTVPDYLLQLTNFDNRGLHNADEVLIQPYPHPVHPNALDKGFLPDPGTVQEKTPLSAAVTAALNEFNGSQAAPKKNLILISDGIGNCSAALGCDDSLAGYQAAEAELLELVPQLVAAQVDLTVVPVGGMIQPHLLNLKDPLNGTTSSGDTNYLTPEVAADLGFNGIGSGSLLFDGAAINDSAYQTWCTNLVNCPDGCNPACADSYAYQNLGKPGVSFRRPMAVLGHIALQMSRAKLGRLCLIQPPDPVINHYIDHDQDPLTPATLDPRFRLDNEPQTVSLIAGVAGEQLEACLDRAPRSFGMEVVLRD